MQLECGMMLVPQQQAGKKGSGVSPGPWVRSTRSSIEEEEIKADKLEEVRGKSPPAPL